MIMDCLAAVVSSHHHAVSSLLFYLHTHKELGLIIKRKFKE
jgi:hypothetical protein